MNNIIIPISIILAGLFVGAGIYFSQSKNINQPVSIKMPENSQQTKIKIVDPETEKIIGDKNAEIFIIEYSDLECKYCKNYHQDVLKNLVGEYKDKKVGFVFRHFPLPIHPSSFGQAIAAECAYQLGGAEKFKPYIEKIFQASKNDGKFPADKLPEFAEEVGLNILNFEQCLKSNNAKKIVQSSYDEAISLGLTSTPTIFVQLKFGGISLPIPADRKIIKDAIDSYLNEIENKK